jgi:hypothetical protein
MVAMVTGHVEPVGGEPQVVDQAAQRFLPLLRRPAEYRRGVHRDYQVRLIGTALSSCV